MPFENVIGSLLRQHLAFSVLSNVPIYRPDSPEERMAGYEIDHLLHARSDINDRLIVIECKGLPVFGRHHGDAPQANGPWNVQYPNDPPKNCKRQVENHARALLSYLRGHSRELLIEAWVVCEPYRGVILEYKPPGRIHYRLIGYDRFESEIKNLKQNEHILPVRQSSLLVALRKGLPLSDIGHPEINNALVYTAKCRNAIDAELFRLFSPSKGCWAINGTAGMGKSVVLAYGLFVIASDRHVIVDLADPANPWRLDSFKERAVEIGLPELSSRSIYAMARKEKQKRVLEDLWLRFVTEYSKLESSLSLRFNKPIFQLWDGSIPDDCNVLIIDEAHDLPPEHHDRIAEWLRQDGMQRYLAIACDRHQLLRLVGADAPLISGINFSGRTKRLKRNYRNPFTVYATSLALMFRWFATAGPKIVPTQTQLKEEFGFDVREYSLAQRGRVQLATWNDSHPGNYWSFTVSAFTSCDEVFSQLESEGCSRDDVLWVRFSAEDETFDYEKLAGFTYHNCFSEESFELVDKYIKGQEFAIVVVEGAPAESESDEWRDAEQTDAERRMWEARRKLYLCCSRSTCFLYFVHHASAAADTGGVLAEIQEVIRQLSHPENPNSRCRRIWSFGFESTGIVRPVPAFSGVEGPEPMPQSIVAIQTEAIIRRPVTVRSLAAALRMEASALVQPLYALGVTFQRSTDVLPDDAAKEVALQLGFILKVEDGGDSAPLIPNTIPPPEGPSTAVQLETQPAKPVIAVSCFDPESQRIIDFVESWEFRHLNKHVDRYLALLAWLLREKPETREVLLKFPRGRRRYFAQTKAEILESAASPNPKSIGASGLWALTTSDNRTKNGIINDVLKDCGYRLPTRQRVMELFER